jgi:FkbM family methyltransferase
MDNRQDKDSLKRLRVSQPLNMIATSTIRALLGSTGVQSEIVIKHLHRVGAVKSRLPNGSTLRLWSRADDWVSNQVYWRGWRGYEPETVPLFFRLATRARITFDVGAYVGFFTLLAAHANPRGRVYAFEPLADAFKRLERNVELNKLDNVLTIGTAVGDVDGSAEFFCAATHMPCSSSLSYDFMKSTDGLSSFTVPVIKLDSLVRENGLHGIDLAKIDTESTEPQVLNGMIETIRRDQPLIICEVLKGRGSEQPLQDVVDSIGYRAFLLTPDGPVLRDRIEGHPVWLNYLLTALSPSEVARL